MMCACVLAALACLLAACLLAWLLGCVAGDLVEHVHCFLPSSRVDSPSPPPYTAPQLWDASTAGEAAQFDEHARRVWSVDFSTTDPMRFLRCEACSVHGAASENVCYIWLLLLSSNSWGTAPKLQHDVLFPGA